MLTFNLKHPYLKINFLVEDTYDLEALEEEFIEATAKFEIEKLICIANRLGTINPDFEATRNVHNLRQSIEIYAEHLKQDEDFDWLDGVEVIPLGDPTEKSLFEAARSNGLGCTLEEYLAQVNDLDMYEMAKLYWLVVEQGYEFDDGIRKLQDTSVYRDNLRATAEEIFDGLYLHQIPESLQTYVNYDSFAYDLRAGSELCEFKFANHTWTAENR